MSASFPPSSVQKAFINDSFNSTMFNNLLTGIYTVLYFGTLYVYANKKGSKNWFVIGTISISFLAYVVLGGLQWFLNKAALIDYGSSLEATFLAFFSPQFAWVIYATDICSFLIGALADGLMIWRCFNVWNRSFHAIALPSFLLLCEIGLDLSVVVMAAVEDFNPSSSQGDILNKLLGSSLFVTFATTLVSTTLIAYRIHSVSKENVIQGTRRRVNHVIEILVQSAAVYSLASFAIAIVTALPQTSSDFEVLYAANDYLSALYFFIAGVAPTIMVARVALATEDADRSTTRISGLQFRSTMPNTTQLGRENLQSQVNADADADLLHAHEKLELKQEAPLHIA